MRTTRLAPLLLVLLLASGCALHGSARHQAVVGSTALYTAIAAVDDTELALAQAGAITPAQHAQLNPKVLALLKAGQAANAAIANWPQGTSAPTEVRAALAQLGLVAHAVIDLLPDGAAKAKLSAAVLLAQDAATTLLLVQGVIGGA